MSITGDYKALVVDDNEMNRKLTVALLKQYGIQSDVAEGGREALDKVQKNTYHLIFMDYRMPEMDGVETTKYLRGLNDYYTEVPVIALTGDDRPEVREIFYSAGMNEILLKPIEKGCLEAVLKKWAPNCVMRQEKAYAGESITTQKEQEQFEGLKTIGIDSAEGIKNCGGKELFVRLLGDFYRLVDLKAVKLVKSLAEGNLEEYTVEVHALKNSARLIGALELSKAFARLENMGNSGSIEGVKKDTPGVLVTMSKYKKALVPYGEVATTEKNLISYERMVECLIAIQEGVEVFDIDSVDRAMEELDRYTIPSSCNKQMELLKAYIADVALEDILKITKEMIQNLEKAD